MSNITTPVDLSELPQGARIRIAFEGTLQTLNIDAGRVNLEAPDGSTLRVDWELHGDPVEDYAPDVTVFDYGFKPGDVVTRRVRAQGELDRWETLLATAPVNPDGPCRFMASSGKFVPVVLADLTLVMRDGFAVRSSDDD